MKRLELRQKSDGASVDELPDGGCRMIRIDVSKLSRTSGTLLLGSLAILVAAFVIVVVSEALPAFSASLGGSLAESAPHATTFWLVNFLYAVGWLLQLLGFVVLTVLLVRFGEMTMAPVALAVAAVATILGIFEATFHAGITTWAAQEVASIGTEPVFYTATRRWISAMKLLSLALGLSAQVGYGVALVKTRLVTAWVGKAALVWGVSWLLLLIVGVGAPAVVFIVPPVMGAALLWRFRIPSASPSDNWKK